MSHTKSATQMQLKGLLTYWTAKQASEAPKSAPQHPIASPAPKLEANKKTVKATASGPVPNTEGDIPKMTPKQASAVTQAEILGAAYGYGVGLNARLPEKLLQKCASDNGISVQELCDSYVTKYAWLGYAGLAAGGAMALPWLYRKLSGPSTYAPGAGVNGAPSGTQFGMQDPKYMKQMGSLMTNEGMRTRQMGGMFDMMDRAYGRGGYMGGMGSHGQ